ncbi:C1q-like domain-containing protein [Cytobacillus sp. Hm23]
MKDKDCKYRVVLPSPPGPPRTPKIVSFRAENNAFQTVNADDTDVIMFPSVLYDCVTPPGNYDPATSTFTAPYDGIYHFTSSAFLSASIGTRALIFIVKLVGVTQMIITCDSIRFTGDLESGCVNVSTSINLLCGEQVQVQLSASSGNVTIDQNTDENSPTCFTGEIVNDMCP